MKTKTATRLLSSAAAIFLLAGQTAWAECRADRRDVDGDGAAEVVMANGRVRLVLDPGGTGRATGFRVESNEFEFVPEGRGLFCDLEYGQQSEQAELLGPYDCQILEGSGDEVAVRLSARGKEGKLEFIEFSKRISLRAGSSAVEARYEIWNLPESEKALPVRPWFRHEVRRTGKGDRWFLPAANGIRTVSPDSEEKSFWEYQPAAGWVAYVSGEGPGLAVVFDEPDLQCLCGWVDKEGAGTIEWRLRPVVIPNGESYPHRMTLIPFRGLRRTDGASRSIVGAFDFPEEMEPGERLSLRANLYAVSTVSDLHASLKCRHFSDGVWRPLPEQSVSFEADAVAQLDFGHIKLREGTTVVRLEVRNDTKRLFWMERAVVAGEPTPDYRLRDTLRLASDSNLLANGSFEAAPDAKSQEGTKNWFHPEAVEGRDDSRAHSGSYSFRTSRIRGPGVQLFLAQVFPLTRGTYSLTGHCVSPDKGTASLRVTLTGEQLESEPEPVVIEVDSGARHWLEVEQTLRAPPGTSDARIELLYRGSGQAWWDDLRLTPLKRRTQTEAEKTDLPYTSDLVTPHVRWAKPLPGGKLKALLLVDARAGREVIELAQRVDLDFDVVTTSPTAKLAEYSVCKIKRKGMHSMARMRARIEQKLSQSFDVIIVGAISGELFSEEAHELLTRSVERGTGLVWVMPIRLPKELRKTDDNLDPGAVEMGEGLDWAPEPTFVEKDRWSLLPFDGIREFLDDPAPWRSRSDHFITRGIPFKHLPPTRYLGYEVSGERIAEIGEEALIAVGELGEGRTVCLNFQAIRALGGKSTQSAKQLRDKHFLCAGLTPRKHTRRCFENVAFPYWEYQLGLVARCALWASKREPAIFIRKVSTPQPEFALGDVPKVEVRLAGGGARDGLALEIHTYAEVTGAASESRQAVDAARLKGVVSLSLPALRIPGRHFCDVILRDADGNSLDWGTTVFHVRPSVRIRELELDEAIWERGAPVEARISLSAAPPADTVCRWAIEDECGRRIDERKAPATKRMELTSEVSRTLTRRFRLVVDLLAGDQLLDRRTALGICSLRTDPWRDFQFVMSSTLDSRTYLQPFLAEQLRDLGITAMRGSEYTEDFARLRNFGLVGTGPGLEEHPEIKVRVVGDEEYELRANCLNDPKNLEDLHRQGARRARQLFISGAIAIGLGDESALGGRERREVCFSEHCVAELRKWLKTRYGDLDALNREWDTSFDRWDEVWPMRSKEVLADEFRKRNYAPWADHREFMDLTVARFHLGLLRAMREENPGIRMGMSGTQRPDVYYGTDWWLLSWAQNYVQAYTVGDQQEMRRSFRRPGVRPPAALVDGEAAEPFKGDGLPGYGWTGYAGIGPRVFQKPFYYLLHGLDSGYWNIHLAVNPDFALSESGSAYAEACRPLLGGLGRLLKAYGRAHDGIAIHYSQASLRVATIEKWNRAFDANRHAWVKAFERLGYQYHFISYEQLERGDLQADEYRVLVLPRSVALSEGEISAVERFAEEGGTVLADDRPGQFNRHCRAREQRLLDKLFGLTLAAEPAASADEIVFKEGLGTGKLAIKPLNACLRAEAAGVSGASGEVPVLFHRQTGKGQAFCLNFSPAAPPDQLGVIDYLLHRSGVARRVDLAKPDGERLLSAERFLYRSGDNWLLASLLPKSVPEALTVSLPGDGYVYDLLEPKPLGRAKEVRLAPNDRRVLLLAQLPYQVQALDVSLPASARLGQDLPVSAELRTDGAPGLHIFRLEVFDPAGELVRHYSRNLDAPNGKVTTTIPLAINDATGTMKIAVSDVISGAKAEGQVPVVR